MYIASFILLIVSIVFFLAVRKKNIIEWLVCMCAHSEMTYGSGTGYLKLRDVYTEFVKQYPVLGIIMPFDYFSSLVDKALKLLKEKLAENEAICDLVADI